MEIRNHSIIDIMDNYQSIWSVSYVISLAEWDLNTYMPLAGATSRGIAIGKLSSLLQGMYLDKTFQAKVVKAEKDKDLNLQEKAIVRRLRREIDQYSKLPKDFVEEFEQVVNQAHVGWREAKEKSDYKIFQPFMEKITTLVRKKADYLGFDNHPYDALIDQFEEGWTKKKLDNFFDDYKVELKQILDSYLEQNPNDKHELEHLPYDQSKMELLNAKVLKMFDFDSNSMRLRLDVSSHPFTQRVASDDVRITTRYHKTDFARSIMATIHEFGHALYELQIDKELEYSPIGEGTSLGIHESQSRFWENVLGRSSTFSELIFDSVNELSPEINQYLKDKDPHDIYKYFTQVKPNLLRVESDEITYHFHIMLRYEIEQGLVDGSIKVSELPEVWNAKMKEYLGIMPKNDAEGVLQDIHWSMGAIGYFPTYSVGTFLSGMWNEMITEQHGKPEFLLKTPGGIEKILNFLKQNIHQYGSTYTFDQLVDKHFKSGFSTKPQLKYLKEKYLK